MSAHCKGFFGEEVITGHTSASFSMICFFSISLKRISLAPVSNVKLCDDLQAVEASEEDSEDVSMAGASADSSRNS